jgi:hypothetical protein
MILELSIGCDLTKFPDQRKMRQQNSSINLVQLEKQFTSIIEYRISTINNVTIQPLNHRTIKP